MTFWIVYIVLAVVNLIFFTHATLKTNVWEEYPGWKNHSLGVLCLIEMAIFFPFVWIHALVEVLKEDDE